MLRSVCRERGPCHRESAFRRAAARAHLPKTRRPDSNKRSKCETTRTSSVPTAGCLRALAGVARWSCRGLMNYVASIPLGRLTGVLDPRVYLALRSVAWSVAKSLAAAGCRVVAISDVSGGYAAPDGIDVARAIEHARRNPSDRGAPHPSLNARRRRLPGYCARTPRLQASPPALRLALQERGGSHAPEAPALGGERGHPRRSLP